jgi:hypothetical protein
LHKIDSTWRHDRTPAVRARAQARSSRSLPYVKPKLLIVDELGYLPLEAQAAHFVGIA